MKKQRVGMGRIWSIYGSMFALLDSREGTGDKSKLAARAADMSVEARCKCALRADALKLLLRFFNMRLNSRLSSVIFAYESIFDKIEARGRSSLNALKLSSSPGASKPASMLSASESQEQFHLLSEFFSEFGPEFEALEGSAYGKNIVSTPEIGTDLYRERNVKDTTLQVMLDLCSFKNKGMRPLRLGHRPLRPRTKALHLRPPYAVVRGFKYVCVCVHACAHVFCILAWGRVCGCMCVQML